MPEPRDRIFIQLGRDRLAGAEGKFAIVALVVVLLAVVAVWYIRSG
jgi:hypothetical protein